jgi:aldehyde dehydrogenase
MRTVACTINGKPVDGTTRGDVVDPARHSEIVGSYPVLDADDVDRAVQAAKAALPAWSALSAAERAQLLKQAGPAMAALPLAEILVSETGKALGEAQGEAMALDFLVDLFGGMAPDLDSPEIITSDANGTMKLYRDPIGVVGATVAWNAPVWLSAGKLIPALIAGNTVVLKPSPVAPLAVLEMGRVLNEYLPPGVVNTVSGEDLVVGSALFNHPDVRMTSFTGGIGGGRAAALAGAGSFTRMLLELGGNDAAVLLEDQPITEALCAELAFCAFTGTGQMCINIKRIYAPEEKVAELADGIAAALDTYVIGDGMDPATTIGPVTTDAQFKRVRGLIESAVAAGGKVRYCGTISADENAGYFLRPAVVTGLDESHPLVAEEQFGPVLPIQGYTSVEQAVSYANATEYGLTASVWTPDLERAEQVARRLQAGGSFINVHSIFCVNMMAPYGGIKSSGLGREYGPIGLLAYTEPHLISNWHAPSQ